QRSGREPVGDEVEIAFVLRQQFPLQSPLDAISEQIERGAAQPLERGEDAKRLHHPRAEAGFPWFSFAISTPEDRRREMEFEALITLELLRQLAGERAVGV